MPPAYYPSTYDKEVLEMGRQLRKNGLPVLDPRNVTNTSIFLADRDWIADLNLHSTWVRHKEDLKKPVPQAR